MKRKTIFVVEISIENGELIINDVYKKHAPTVDDSVAEKLQSYLGSHKLTLFPTERKALLRLLIEFFQQASPILGITPPRFIAWVALQLASFRKSNTKEGYVAEKELSREVQKIHRELSGEE